MDEKNNKKQLTWYSFIIVSIVTSLLLVYLPMLTTIKYSLFDVSVIGFGEKFAGLKNYKILLTQSTFLKSLWNTVVLAILGLLTIPLGFILAVLINSLGSGRTQSFFRIGLSSKYHYWSQCNPNVSGCLCREMEDC